MPEELIPTERILAGLAESAGRIAEATRGMSEKQLHAAPTAGEWSANEVLAHLRACSDVWGKCMADVLAKDKPQWRAVNPRTYILGTDFLGQDFVPALKAFTAQRKRLLALLKPLPAKAWQRYAIATGVGRILRPTVHAYAHRLWTHERGHVKQIERIAEAVRGGTPYPTAASRAQAKPKPAGVTAFEFSGRIWFWKGPAPWYFVTVPAKQSRELNVLMRLVTYGWGMIPVRVRIGRTEWATSLWPKEGKFIVPIKATVRKAEKLEKGDNVSIRLELA